MTQSDIIRTKRRGKKINAGSKGKGQFSEMQYSWELIDGTPILQGRKC